ncbi:MAG: DUF4234 domain-containing protein [Myxococcales bacterium]|nr:DUF4234 domain-containing protein [Myxococcales bacterium]
MKQRSPIAVFFLPIITFGIYGLVWLVKTKNEMNESGAEIPTAWLLIVPIANLYWFWKYCEGVQKISRGSMSAPVALLLMLLLGNIGWAVLQSTFNQRALPAAAA